MKSETPTRSFRVLVVDDCHDNADMLAKLLQIIGHEVAIAYDATAAHKAAAEFLPHLALLDIGMPEPQ